ncbi:MAG: polysaccharide deacetylase [Bacteroides sp.]|nr:polysaccharide deacetylase [Bacteroides sp.]MCM1549454.1 polysaccharide deacetylase [Clostridium sp.]
MEQKTTEVPKKEQVNMDLARRKRINRYKAAIIWLFLALTVLPVLSSSILLGRVDAMERKVLTMAGAEGSDLTTLRSSGEALLSNPNVNMELLTGDVLEDMARPADLERQEPAGEEPKRVYLTFDDGPSIYTGQILDILNANDVKATFFVIARENESYWPYYTRILEEGHTLGMHSYTHDYNQVYASLDTFEADVTRLSGFLYDRTGVYPTIYRFPGGSSNSVSHVPIDECIAYLNEQGITYYDWNALNGDAVTDELSADRLIENIMNSVRQNNTSIVLMHDMQSRHNTVESLQELIDILKEEGYEILPIDEDTPLIQHIPYDSGFQGATD